MATNGTVTVRVDPDTQRLVRTLRIISKHLMALAEELEAEVLHAEVLHAED